MQWLKGLADNQLFFVTDAGASYNSVLQGERAIGLTSFKSIYSQAAGAPTKPSYFVNEFVSAYPALISSKAPHPNTARLFVNYMLSPAGQQVIAKMGSTPATPVQSPTSLSSILPANHTPLVSEGSMADFIANPTSYQKIFMQYWPQ
jgi:iron(III) transport system substrate-binding protein